MIALSGGELISFELSANGQLMELMKKDMPGDVACLDLLPVPEGRQRAKFLAVGAYDNTVRPLCACDEYVWLVTVFLVSRSMPRVCRRPKLQVKSPANALCGPVTMFSRACFARELRPG